MRTRSGTWLVGIVLVAMTWCLDAAADTDRDAARQHFDRATTHMQAGELEPALKELEAAYALHPHFAVLRHMAEVHAALGHPDRAVELYERYLEQADDTVSVDRRREVAAAVERQKARLASVTLEVAPEGAHVRVDGKEVGTAPLTRPLLLLPGLHELAVSLSGYESKERTIEVAKGSNPIVYASLRKKPQPTAALAMVDIECPIADAVVRVDGEARLQTPIRALALPAGRHRLSFERLGYESKQFDILADPRGSSAVRCGLRPLRHLPPRLAGRVVVALAPGARLQIDGEPSGSEATLPVGKHLLSVTADDFAPWSTQVVLEPGATLHVHPSLQPDGQTMRARQSQRTLAYTLGGGGIALLGVAGAIYFWNDIRYQDWQNHQADLDDEWAQDPNRRSSTLVERQAKTDKDLESIQAFDRLVIGSGVAGAALLAGGVVLYLSGEDPGAGAHPVVAVAPRSSWAGWRWTW